MEACLGGSQPPDHGQKWPFFVHQNNDWSQGSRTTCLCYKTRPLPGRGGYCPICTWQSGGRASRGGCVVYPGLTILGVCIALLREGPTSEGMMAQIYAQLNDREPLRLTVAISMVGTPWHWSTHVNRAADQGVNMKTGNFGEWTLRFRSASAPPKVEDRSSQDPKHCENIRRKEIQRTSLCGTRNIWETHGSQEQGYL